MLPLNRSELEESNRQAVLAFSWFASHCERGQIAGLDGITFAWGDTMMPVYNIAFLSSPVRDENDLRQRVAAAATFAKPRQYPWLVVLGDEWLPSGLFSKTAGIVKAEAGLEPMMIWTGMVAEKIPSPAAPPELECRRVTTVEGGIHLSDVNSIAYGMPVEWGHEAANRTEFWTGDLHACVGYLDGMPVCGAATLPIDGALYVAMVATHPDHRRKGYADAIMRYALDSASKATGLERTVLHATEAGYPVYLRMGYRPVTKFTLYGPAEPHQ